MFECYDNIFGFSAFDCECLATGRPEDYGVSKSGLYLDEIANIAALLSLDNCGKDIWETLIAARKLGIKTLVTESNNLLTKHFALKRQPVDGQVLGKIKAIDTYAPNKNYAVIRVACNPIKGGYFTLQNLGTIFEAIGAFNVSLYDNVSGFIETFAVTSLLNKHNKTAVKKKYPLHSKYTECLEYYFVYAFDENNRPKDNAVHCGCGGVTLSYALESPYFVHGHKNAAWTNFVMVGSTTINSLAELEDLPAVASNKMLGLTLEMDFGCEVNQVLCNEALDFTGNPLALSLAFAAMYATAVEIGKAILRNPGLSPENMAGSDTWLESIDDWQTKYNEHLNYLIPSINLKANDCLTCKDLLGITRQGLFA